MNDGNIIEDAARIQKKKDLCDINIVELEAVLRKINLALKWNLKDLEIKTDTMKGVNWLKSIILKDKRKKTKGVAELLMKRRLGILNQLIN